MILSLTLRKRPSDIVLKFQHACARRRAHETEWSQVPGRRPRNADSANSHSCTAHVVAAVLCALPLRIDNGVEPAKVTLYSSSIGA